MKKILLLTAAGLFATGALAHDILRNNLDTNDHVLLDPVMVQKGDFYGTSLAEANDEPWGNGAPIGYAPKEAGNGEQYGSVLFDVQPDLERIF